jgi:hypothetical protein
MPDLAVEGESLAGTVECVGEAALVLVHLAVVEVHVCLARAVPDCLEAAQRLAEVVERVVVAAQPSVRAGQRAVRVRLRGRVAQPPRRRDRDLVRDDQLLPVPAPVEVRGKRPGEPPRVGVVAGGRRTRDDSQEDPAFRGEPAERRLLARRARHSGRWV